MDHVIDVFRRLGYVIGNESSDWSVLWSHDFPFNTLSNQIRRRLSRDHEIFVNHLPGSGVITNKQSLRDLEASFIPKTFHLPREHENFLQYVRSLILFLIFLWCQLFFLCVNFISFYVQNFGSKIVSFTKLFLFQLRNNPDKEKWVQKSVKHRGIRLTTGRGLSFCIFWYILKVSIVYDAPYT